jgi:hypothetical protein
MTRDLQDQLNRASWVEWCQLCDEHDLDLPIPDRFISPVSELSEDPSPFTPGRFQAMRWLEDS